MIKDNSQNVLLVDDEQHILLSSESALHLHGIHEVITLDDSRQVLPTLEAKNISLIVLDLFMPYLSGIELLNIIKLKYPQILVIVMTAADEVKIAVDCMKAGAFDYLVKPVDNTRLITSVKRGWRYAA